MSGERVDIPGPERINSPSHGARRVWARYSQAAAYIILLARVEWDLGDLGDLAELVWVGRDTIRRRLGRAAGWVAVQPSCFDEVEVIPEDFTPWRRRWLAGFRYETPEGQGMFWPMAA